MDKLFSKTATLYNKGDQRFYQHFNIHPSTAMVYGDKPEDIVIVDMEIAEDQTIPDESKPDNTADYWGWYDNKKQDFTLIYAKRFLLNMCFPSGIKGSEEADSGKAYRLKIVAILPYENKE